jgi:hypothetical protein
MRERTQVTAPVPSARRLAFGHPSAEEWRIGLRARFALWQGTRCQELGPEPAGAAPSAVIARAFWHAAVFGRLGDDRCARFLRLAEGASGRTKHVVPQFTTEMLIAGRDPEALEVLDRAIAAGLEDLSWLDACPLLAPASLDARWQRWRAVVVDRASLVRDAWQRGLEA